MPIREPAFQWEVREYEEKNRSSDWFWGLGIIAFALVILAIVFGNPILALLIVVFAIILALRSIKKPRQMRYGVDRRGVRVNNEIYPYASISSFWVNDNPQRSRLFIKLKRGMAYRLVIPIEGPDPDDVRDYLLEFLFEEEMHETLSDRVLDIFDL